MAAPLLYNVRTLRVDTHHPVESVVPKVYEPSGLLQASRFLSVNFHSKVSTCLPIQRESRREPVPMYFRSAQSGRRAVPPQPQPGAGRRRL